MSKNINNRNDTPDKVDVNPSHLSDPASLAELDSGDIMDPKYEGDGLADVEFKPGADFEVDDALFQGVTMKEDFLDFSLSYTDHAYCNAELEAPERSVGGMLEVGNEEEIQDICLFQDVGDRAVGTVENSQTSKKRTRLEESKGQDEGPSEDKKRVPLVKTYNMRSKRLAADGKDGQQDDANEEKKMQPVVKKRKVEPVEATNIEESSGEDEENEDEETDSEEEVTVQSKRKQVPPRKEAASKGKQKGKNAKGKKPVKGKQVAKKATKADSDDDEEEEEEEEQVAAKKSKKTSAKGKAGGGKRQRKLKKKPEAETSEESEEELEESESEDEEMEEVPVKGGKGNQKRKGKGTLPLMKKRKTTKKKLVAAKAADESDSNETSSDDLPLQEVKKMNKKKAEASNRKKAKKEDMEESSEEDNEEDGDGNYDVGNMETRSKKSQGGNRDPILSAFTKSPGVLMTDDSASVCSTDDGTPGLRTSSRIKKPNRLYIMDSSSSLTIGNAVAASQKMEKITKSKCKEQMTSKAEAPAAVMDISETTDTDALVIDESPVKFSAAVAIGSMKKQTLPVVANKGEELEEEQVNEEEDEEDRDEEEDSNKSGELGIDESQQITSETPEVTKRSARLKMLEEASQEKFKAYRAERERTEAKNEALKKKNQEKLENEMEKEEKPKPTAIKVGKDVLTKQSSAMAVKNPCRGPNCGKASLPTSVYCSDVCIQNHALESIRLIEQERQKSQPQRTKVESSGATPVLSKSDERIVVFERKTGKLLTGPVAPTESTLLAWLKKHPTFEVLQPSSHSPAASFTAKKDKKPEKKVPVKEAKPPASKEPVKAPVTAAASQQRDTESPMYSGSGTKEERTKTITMQQLQEIGPDHGKSASVHRTFPKAPPEVSGGGSYSRGGPDPARISIRNTLRETLFARANETDDVMLSGPEIKRLALDIEQELFGYYGEVNTKYKHKYRTLITHLKDPTNKGLFRKVLFGEIKPSRLVRLSSDSLGSRELAYWKEPHAKAMQDNLFEAKPTKKVESTPKSPFYDNSYDYLSSIIVDTTPQHGNHFFDINCKICTGKIPEPLYYDSSKPSHVPSVALKEETIPPVVVDAEPVIPSKPTKDDERVSTIEFSRDPRRSKGAVTTNSGTVGTLTVATSKTEEKPAAIVSPPSIVSPVFVQTPPTDVSSGYQMGPVEPLVLWKGSIYAHDVAKVMVCAYLVSGSLPVLKEDLSDLIVISGRLPPDNVYFYLSQIKQSGTLNRDIAVVRFESAVLHNDDLYNQLFSYLNSRDRCGVVSGSGGPTVKDMYIVPVASHAGLPSILLPFDGPGLVDDHPNLLLGIIIKHSSRRPAVASSPARPLPAPAPTPAPASTPTPPVAASTKTWMYSERTEMKDELYPETKRSGTRHGTKHTETTAQRSEPVEEYTPLLPTFESKALGQSKLSSAAKVAESGNASKLSSASKVAESGNAESSGASDVDDTEGWSEVACKDPIISKYSKFDKGSKTVTRKPVAVNDFDDEDKPYDPFEDDDNKPYDPSSPEFVATSVLATTSGMAVKVNQAAKAAAPAVMLPAQPGSTLSSGSSIDLAQLLKPISGLSNTTDVTAAMLTTLAAISTTTNVEEQRRLLSELTEKINEQQVYLDKQKEELTKKESQIGHTLSNVPTSGIASTGLGLIGSGGMLGQHGPTSSSSIGVSTLSSSVTSTRVSGPGKAQAEPGPASRKSNTEMTSLPPSSQESLSQKPSQMSVLSQIPVDSSAVLNLARKRLAQKAGETRPKQELAPSVSGVKSDVKIDSETPRLASENLKQNTVAPIGKQDSVTQSAFSCNLSVLPLSVQQLLSGPSFENLKSIVANVTGKKTSDGSGQFVEPNKTIEATAADLNAQVKPVSGISLDRDSDKGQKYPEATIKDLSVSANKDHDIDGGKNIFASNRHGDVDYRVQSHSSSDAPLPSKGFVDIQRPMSHVTPFSGYSGSNALQYPDSRGKMDIPTPQFLNAAAFAASSGPGLMGPGPAHLMLRAGESGMFRPSMQALLETPSDPVSKSSSEVKPALLETPDMPPASAPKTNQEFPDVNQAVFSRPMQRPPFPPDIPHPPYPMEMQRPRFLSDMERPPFSADSRGPQLKAEFQRLPFPPQIPRPPLLPDIPQPPFPPQMPRPPFPPGMQRPTFVPEMPRPPFMPEMPRMSIPSKGPVSCGTEIHLTETSTGSLHSESSIRFSAPGLLPAPKPVDSAAKTQDDLSSPSDRYFAAKSVQQGTTLAPRTESNAGDASKPFSVGDFLKQLDSSRNQLPGFTSHSTKESKDSSHNLQLVSSSDDAIHRERKVLLPTPTTESKKIPEKAHDIQSKKKDESKISRVPDEQKQKLQSNKNPDGAPPTVQRWSAKSDWEKNSGDTASPSDSASVIVIDDNSVKVEKDSVEMIPLPPGSAKVDKAEDNEVEVEIISCSTAGMEEKSADGHRNEKRSSLDQPRSSRSADRSRSRSRRKSREVPDIRARRSDRGHQLRSHDRHRKSRSRERSNIGQTNQRGRRRSRERISNSYRPRSRHSGNDQSKHPLRDQRHISPLADPRKREEDKALQIRDRNQDSHNRSSLSDQSSCERITTQYNRLLQGGILCVDDKVPKQASIPSLIDMMEPPESQHPKPAIPSLLDIMGVSRESISLSVRGGSDSKQNSRNSHSTTSGTVDMKYRRDYKHGTDSEEGEEQGRNSFVRTPEFAERNQSFSGSHGPPEFWKQIDVEMQPSESRDLGRHPPGGHGNFRRPERFHFERRDVIEEQQASAMDVGAGHSYVDSENSFGRQFLETSGPPKRPLIDKPPERDFERPEFGRPMPNLLQERTGKRGDIGPDEHLTNMPDERFGVGFSNMEEGRHRGGSGPDGGRMPSNFHRERPFPSQFSPGPNPEKQMYGAGPGGPGSTLMMGLEADESSGRYAHPSMLKKSLLGDYPGTVQELREETPVVTGLFESQARGKDLGRERNVGPDERRLGPPPLMPEPYHTAEGKQTALMPEPRHNVEGKQTPPGWAPGVGDGISVQPRLPNQRFPSNIQGIRPGFGSIPPQRPPQMGMMPRMRMSHEFGRAPEQQAPQFSGGPESQSHWRNPVPHDRIPENRGRQFPSAEMEGQLEGTESISEKKTLLPMPRMPGPRLSEMPVRMGPGPRQMMPSHVDVPMFMARPGMRMPLRFSPHRPMSSPEGPHQTGLRPQAPADHRPRGPSA